MDEVDTDLNELQIKAVMKRLTRTPSIALPDDGMGYGIAPSTFRHVLDILDTMSTSVRELMHERQELLDKIDNENRRKVIAGGYLRDILAAGIAGPDDGLEDL